MITGELRILTNKGRIPELGRHLHLFWGSGAVFCWSFRVRCGSVKVVSSSHCSLWGFTAELRVHTHKAEGTRATVV